VAQDDVEFARWVGAALPGLLRFGHVLTGSPASAEDLVQTALVKTWSVVSRRTSGPAIEDLSAYVRRVMVNSYASWWRRSSGRESTLPVIASVVVDPSGAWDEREAIVRALATLPAKQRAVIVLRFYEDLSEADIAAVMGIARGTVKSHASRAMAHLERVLAPADGVGDDLRGALP
jgi:RNA polymerase sigma-70 factor (sigma-E family)